MLIRDYIKPNERLAQFAVKPKNKLKRFFHTLVRYKGIKNKFLEIESDPSWQ